MPNVVVVRFRAGVPAAAGAVIDTVTKKIVARIPTSEKLLEIDFLGDAVFRVGDQFGLAGSRS